MVGIGFFVTDKNDFIYDSKVLSDKVAVGVTTTVTVTYDDDTPIPTDDVSITSVGEAGYVNVSKGTITFTGTYAGKATIVAFAGGVTGAKEVTVTSE